MRRNEDIIAVESGGNIINIPNEVIEKIKEKKEMEIHEESPFQKVRMHNLDDIQKVFKNVTIQS